MSKWDIIAALAGLLATITMGVGAWVLQRFQQKEKAEYTTQVEAIASVVEATASRIDERREEEWQVVRRLVSEYHHQALSQAKVQFWFSVIGASSGFALIIVAIIMALMQQTTTIQTVLQVVPGIAIEAVAALFFKQAAETRERATALYDRLRTDRERTYALSLVDSIDNSNVRNAVKAELALHMAGLATSPLAQILPGLLGATLSVPQDQGVLNQASGNASTDRQSTASPVTSVNEVQPPLNAA